jgi:hypothetical protein
MVVKINKTEVEVQHETPVSCNNVNDGCGVGVLPDHVERIFGSLG